MTITLDRDVCGDFERLAGLEWLETNGLGGWASSTVSGVHSTLRMPRNSLITG